MKYCYPKEMQSATDIIKKKKKNPKRKKEEKKKKHMQRVKQSWVINTLIQHGIPVLDIKDCENQINNVLSCMEHTC
jgi:hypothetical protein